jgi:hypothetical protein
MLIPFSLKTRAWKNLLPRWERADEVASLAERHKSSFSVQIDQNLASSELQENPGGCKKVPIQTHRVITLDKFPARRDLSTARIRVNSLLFNRFSRGKLSVYVWFRARCT